MSRHRYGKKSRHKGEPKLMGSGLNDEAQIEKMLQDNKRKQNGINTGSRTRLGLGRAHVQEEREEEGERVREGEK